MDNKAVFSCEHNSGELSKENFYGNQKPFHNIWPGEELTPERRHIIIIIIQVYHKKRTSEEQIQTTRSKPGLNLKKRPYRLDFIKILE